MTASQFRPLLRELPADATNEEALAWVNRMRHVAAWWNDLPEYASQSIPPELRKEVQEELDKMERMLRKDMASPADA